MMRDLVFGTTSSRSRMAGPRCSASSNRATCRSESGGFTVADLAAKVNANTGEHYTVRQAAYDLRKLRGKGLVRKPGRTRRYHVPGGIPCPPRCWLR